MALADDIARMEGTLNRLVDIIGHEGDDGISGQGLMGKVARIDARTIEHEKYLHRVFGGFAVVGVAGAAILLFFKTIFAALVTGVVAPPHP